MSIVDIIIIVVLLFYVLKGFSNGVLKEGVSFIGGIAVIVLAFLLKNPLSVFLYQTLPFFKFGGMLSGISVLNIIIYELIAFLMVAVVLLVIYEMILKVTRLIDTIVKLTFVFALPSKLLGIIVGFVEGIVMVFILLFVFMQFEVTREFITKSKYADSILANTPVLGQAVKPVYNSLKEIYDVAEHYKDEEDKDKANLESLDILMKYNVIEPKNVEILHSSGKLKMAGVEELVEKYNK